jgi:HAD superfamily hydrolase (TIGR01484 family)
MKYRALASDGHGTLLVNGKMSEHTVKALERVRDANLFLLLVTGKRRPELAEFPHLDLFHLVVAENGAVLFNPSNGLEIVLGQSPPASLVDALHNAGITGLKIGRSMISARVSEEALLRREVERLRLDWQVIRNRHDAMVLPPGIDKASGIAAAINELNLRFDQVIAVGDAENDAPMLSRCGLGIAVANAITALKERADATTIGSAGQGIIELVDRILTGNVESIGRGN